MRLNVLLPVFGLLACLCASAAGPVLAQPWGPDGEGRGVLPLDRILPDIRRSHPGQFYDADGPTPGPGGSQHYRLKWMTPDGRIEYLDADARTGRVVGKSSARENRQGFGRGPGTGFAPPGYGPPPPGFDRSRDPGPGQASGQPWRDRRGDGYDGRREPRRGR